MRRGTHRRRASGRVRRFELLELEPRALMTAILVPGQSDGPLHQPPEIRSVDGVLRAEATITRAGMPGSGRPVLWGGEPIFSNPNLTPEIPPQSPRPNANFAAGYQFTTADGVVLPPQFPAPTLRIEPGDVLDLTLHNALGDDPPDPPPPAVTYITNLHAHGFLVSPLGDGDNVYRQMLPGGSYRTRIEVPTTQQAGVNWYHTHQHGSTADQVYGGLAGFFQVGDALDPWPDLVGNYDERLLGLTLVNVAIDPQTGERMPANLGYTKRQQPPYGQDWQKLINGQFNPEITLRPGETEIWTFSSIGRNGFYNLGIVDANGENGWAGTVISHDGNSHDLIPRPVSLALPTPYLVEGPTFVAPGARLTMAVTAPQEPGTYYLVDNLAPNINPLDTFFALATIQVEGDPVTEPPPVFSPVGTIPEVYHLPPDHQRTFTFDIEGNVFTINGSAFPDGPIVSIQAGQVEEWTLVNASGVDHPFHIHQTDFAVISINGEPVSFDGSGTYPYVSERDTITIPANGEVVIRWRVTPHLGKYVFHCHILTHEDAGMMMSVLAGPNEDQRRIALGAARGGGGSVLVQDGNGERVGVVNPLPRGWTGGVATAVGDLTSDLVQDIVTAPNAFGGGGWIVAYDGQDLRPILRFRPFPESPRAGMNLAVGDLDRDGRAEIVAARIGPGPSLVRIFDADGTLRRELVGTLPGQFPRGVTIASADFNGDNYDDLAIGAGLGRAPLVVGLDGYSLGGDPHTVPVRLFEFNAPGNTWSGVQVAGGYYDPRTRPGLLANLITTPILGPDAGQVTVWNVARSLGSYHGMSASHASGSHDASMRPAPDALATFRPLGRRPALGLRLQVSRLGSLGLDALVAWLRPHFPTYVNIDDQGTIRDLHPPRS
ncbi:multicopper oxidase domain-containing protein [Tautonia marina]|uniref:multicopper oxidase domain-containing protein n=1 Tax=Tautonia marina TaxID=2653855 RepID=UPI00137579F5|nr:multicopper oxidase domain-containing protein [Tautonia marina]